MTWRDWFLMVVACLGIVVVLEIITRTFELGGNQRGWLDVIGTGVVILMFAAWKRWRGE
jgi:hypothetical protein